MSERHSAASADLKKVRVLLATFVGISVVENPIVVHSRQISIVAVCRHNVVADHRNATALIFVKIESLQMGRMPSPSARWRLCSSLANKVNTGLHRNPSICRLSEGFTKI